MNLTTRSNAGFTLVSGIIAATLLAVAAYGVVQYASALNQHRRELDTMTQENSYRVFQNEVALTGATPVGMSNPLGASSTANSPMPAISYVSSAGRNQAGSAKVDAYSASPDLAYRSGALGFRIESTGTAVSTSSSGQLKSPTFRVNGTVPESEFAPNLTNLILADSSNPPGTVYRYTIDGSDPTLSSPIWTSSSYLLAAPLPSIVKSAAFNSDPQYTTSNVVTANLTRNLAVVFGRAGGGSSTGFLYTEVTGGTNGITLTVPNQPAGTNIYYTYDGSAPTTSSNHYVGPFQVPLAAWSATVTLRAIADTGAANISVTPLSIVLTPTQVSLPPPTFGSEGGTSTLITVPVSVSVPNAIIRYDIDTGVSGASPTVLNPGTVSIVAP